MMHVALVGHHHKISYVYASLHESVGLYVPLYETYYVYFN